uniref:Uncharacterized protein n=1 Tax=Skeletonema marinoi TaxID=267567 RepID=A0A7S2LMD0_9STRA
MLSIIQHRFRRPIKASARQTSSSLERKPFDFDVAHHRFTLLAYMRILMPLFIIFAILCATISNIIFYSIPRRYGDRFVYQLMHISRQLRYQHGNNHRGCF